jgi:heptaprenylglyceryl phosphate synthase
VDALKAGADIVVVGNALEKTPTLLNEIAFGISKLNQ